MLLTQPYPSKDHSAVVRPRVARLLGKGLGWIEGEMEHKRMRRLAKPALAYVVFPPDDLKRNSYRLPCQLGQHQSHVRRHYRLRHARMCIILSLTAALRDKFPGRQ